MSGEISSRGVAYTKHLDLTQTKEIYETPIQNWAFIYETSLTRNSEFHVGDKVCLPGGREFIYAKSAGVCNAGRGCEFTAGGVMTGVWLDQAQVVGDEQITQSA